MADQCLQNRRILVVEDEYFVATELAHVLRQAGAVVVGPAASVEEALAAIDGADSLDGAMLDINLRGEMVFPVIDELMTRGVPFVLATGYQARDIPVRFAHALCIHKPFEPRAVTSALTRMLRLCKSESSGG